jgi:hypothetical protein
MISNSYLRYKVLKILKTFIMNNFDIENPLFLKRINEINDLSKTRNNFKKIIVNDDKETLV